MRDAPSNLAKKYSSNRPRSKNVDANFDNRNANTLMSQSGPDRVLFGKEEARGCAFGLAQYILNIRAVSLSGPNVHNERSYALRIHIFALAKSDTWKCTQQRQSVQFL